MATGVVLLAAGSGKRFGSKRPKQLSTLAGKPLFLHSLNTFARLPSLKEMVLVVSPKEVKTYQRRIRSVRLRKPIRVVVGGRYRGESVKKGVQASSKNLDVVLVHDTARPLVDLAVIKRVESAAKRFGVALAAWPLPDTLKKVSKSNKVRKTIPRKGLWIAQTPQGFRGSIAQKVLLFPSQRATDDVELAERKGFNVRVVLGDPRNFKVTYPYDLTLCRALTKK